MALFRSRVKKKTRNCCCLFCGEQVEGEFTFDVPDVGKYSPFALLLLLFIRPVLRFTSPGPNSPQTFSAMFHTVKPEEEEDEDEEETAKYSSILFCF
jgi:hypothetical protein